MKELLSEKVVVKRRTQMKSEHVKHPQLENAGGVIPVAYISVIVGLFTLGSVD